MADDIKKTKDKNLHKGHRERMRKKFLKEGCRNLEDHELLEMLLYYCIPMKNTNETAHEFLNKFHNLSLLLEAQPEEIMKRCNTTQNISMFFNLINEVMKRANLEKWRDRPVLNSTTLSGEFAVSLLAYEVHECFYLVSVDSQNRIISTSLISKGVVNETYVNTRKTIETALSANAANVIFMHNHPGGTLRPSMDDIRMTNNLVKIFNLLDITVLDHIIVADNDYFSMADSDLLKNKVIKKEE